MKDEHRSPPRDSWRRHPEARSDNSVGLPTARRNYALAIVIALIVFVLLIAMRVLWGDFAPRHTLPPAALQDETNPPASN
jgi:hypothetical protein